MSERFRFSLTRTAADNWQAFEYLASTFLADEYGELRTLASPSGDEGRDATLFQPVDDNSVALQYSVQQDWKSKIRRTARRLADTFPNVTALVYATPLRIGADGDEVKSTIRRDFHVHLDIRDEHYFAERQDRSTATALAAERYCRQIVDPILEDAVVLDRTGARLNTHEARAALLYLVLQHQDAQADRHLTKLCYDALVLAVLRNTDNDSRLNREAIHRAVRDLLPTHAALEVAGYVDRALERLNKHAVRHWTKPDEFCLTFDERKKIADGLAGLAILNDEFEHELIGNLRFVAEGMEVDLSLADLTSVTTRLRRVLERFLFERGEAFVESITAGQELLFIGEELYQAANSDFLAHPDTSTIRTAMVRLTSDTLERILRFPGERVQRYLRAVGDGYTLLAFLRETPNVQSAVSKLFSSGEIWLDTTAVLPLLAEELLDEHERAYTSVFRAAQEAGVQLHVSPGVVEELASHFENAIQAWRSAATWNGRTPFVLQSYIWSGRSIDKFSQWVEGFRGRVRPTDDLVEYLEQELRITLFDLASDASQCQDQLRWHTEAYWEEIHAKRRPPGKADPEITRRLASHDAENFLGVIHRRGGEQVGNPFGYTTWWLTLDRYARGASKEIAERVGLTALASPVLSIDFLTYYLIVGPARRQLRKSTEQRLPLMVDQSLLDALPTELMKAAEQARRDVEGQTDRVVRRRIRDHLDQQKLRAGPVSRTGIDAIKQDIRLALQKGKRGSHSYAAPS